MEAAAGLCPAAVFFGAPGLARSALTGAVLVQVALAVNRLKYRLIESKNAPGDVRGICGLL